MGLSGLRLDGFRGLMVPQLRGEGNWPTVAANATFERRIMYATDAMMSAIPFWTKVGLPKVQLVTDR